MNLARLFGPLLIAALALSVAAPSAYATSGDPEVVETVAEIRAPADAPTPAPLDLSDLIGPITIFSAMAAVAKVRVRPVAPVGYEVNDKCELAEDVTRGDLLKFTGTSSNGLPLMGLAAGGATEVDGIALMDGHAGMRGFSYGVQGEIDGFDTAIAPGTAVYPSATVAGGIDTVAAGAIRMKVVKAGRIRYNFV